MCKIKNQLKCNYIFYQLLNREREREREVTLLYVLHQVVYSTNYMTPSRKITINAKVKNKIFFFCEESKK